MLLYCIVLLHLQCNVAWKNTPPTVSQSLEKETCRETASVAVNTSVMVKICQNLKYIIQICAQVACGI